MAENIKTTDGESYALTVRIANAIKEWYWLVLLILSLTTTAFYAAARVSYNPVYQSYASLTPSYRDGETADKVGEIAKELVAKAEDGSLAAALAGTVGENVKNADIRFVADGLNLAVSVRASSAELSYETLRAIVTAGVQLLDEERDYKLVLVSESGLPQAVTNPLNVDAEAHRGLLMGAALSVVFLIVCALRGKKNAVGNEEAVYAAVEAEPADNRVEPVFAKAETAQREPEPVRAEPEPFKAGASAFRPEPEPVRAEPEPFKAGASAFRPEPVRVEPEPFRAEPEPVRTEPAPETVKAAEPAEAAVPAEEPKTAQGGIPADLARFASVIGAGNFEIPAAPKKEEMKKEEILEVPQETEVPAVEEELQEESFSAVPAAEEAPEEERSYDDEEWDPAKTSLSREMWEIAKEMGMLDDFRI